MTGRLLFVLILGFWAALGPACSQESNQSGGNKKPSNNAKKAGNDANEGGSGSNEDGDDDDNDGNDGDSRSGGKGGGGTSGGGGTAGSNKSEACTIKRAFSQNMGGAIDEQGSIDMNGLPMSTGAKWI